MKITIVGGGISGLSLAYFLLQQEPSLEIEIFEELERPGGKIWTERADGFLCEWGVNGFLDNKPRTLELASALNISPLKSNDNARKRFIYSAQKLHLLPESPGAFLKSDLLSLAGRLRVLYEPFAPKGREDDETLESFAVRRLGRDAYEKLIDPMATGIYAGNSSTLSLKSCFPRIHELEQGYGSLIRAMFKLQKEAKKTGRKVGAGPGGVLTSFLDGMQTIIDALRKEVGERLRLSSKVIAIDRQDAHYAIFFENGEKVETDILVLATPAHATAKIVKGISMNLSELLQKIPYPSVAVACLGFRKEKIEHSLDGFGYLVPSREKKKILGTLWDSSIFPNRAPEDHVLLRIMVGGARASHLAMQEDNKLLDDVLGELKTIMGIHADPDFVRIYRHESAIPQYNLGHQQLLDDMNTIMVKLRGLYFSGNAYRGIGLNDCIDNSFKLKDKILGL